MGCSTPGFPVHHQLPELTKLMPIELVMPSNHLTLCRPLLLQPSIFPRTYKVAYDVAGSTLSGYFKRCPPGKAKQELAADILSSGPYLTVQTLGVSGVLTPTTEACEPRARALQPERPRPWEAHTLRWRGAPPAAAREKPAQQQEPSTAKNKESEL